MAARKVKGRPLADRTRDLQRETGGFTEFVGFPFVHMAAPIYLKHGARRGPTWREVVLMHAIARIYYAGLIDHIQASWVKLGASGSRQLFSAGVDALGGTLMDENVSRATGASHGQAMDEDHARAGRGTRPQPETAHDPVRRSNPSTNLNRL